MKVIATKSLHTAYLLSKLENTLLIPSMILSTLSSPISRLQIAYSPTYCSYTSHWHGLAEILPLFTIKYHYQIGFQLLKC